MILKWKTQRMTCPEEEQGQRKGITPKPLSSPFPSRQVPLIAYAVFRPCPQFYLI